MLDLQVEKYIMGGDRINIFLGAFINCTNAQNLNCLALAKYLNKEKFNVYTLELYSGKLPSQKTALPEIKIFFAFWPYRISVYLGFLWGIWKCDIAYLPKSELWKFNKFLLKVFGKRSFSTIEGIMDDIALGNSIKSLGSYSSYISSRSYFDRQYSITRFMKKYNYEKLGIQTEENILYLGVDAETNEFKKANSVLKSIIMVGNDLVRKGIDDYIEVAKNFPDICFYVAGSGNGVINIEEEIKNRALNNMVYKGLLSSDKLKELLKEVQLHILPSRSEGFPKVTLETAAAGVPSIVYSDYGADEWITTGLNGWVIQNIEDIINIIQRLKSEPKLLESFSKEAIKLAATFNWKYKIKNWEAVIEAQVK